MVKLVAVLDERPNLEQTDALLTELRQMPRDHVVEGLIDDLLDYRAMLVATTA